jgi:hypothetical protein
VQADVTDPVEDPVAERQTLRFGSGHLTSTSFAGLSLVP